MATKINLVIAKKNKIEAPKITSSFFRWVIVSFFLITAISIGVYTYSFALSRQKETLAKDIETLEAKVESYKEIEERKSILAIKIDEIKKVYDNRFDYVKAIQDVQKLFANSLTINSINSQIDGTVVVKALKTGPITISESEALTTNITELTLSLTVSSSEELQQSVDQLRSFLGKGLSTAEVAGSEKTDDGYLVDFVITFESEKNPKKEPK
jgi:hypothetical protein